MGMHKIDLGGPMDFIYYKSRAKISWDYSHRNTGSEPYIHVSKLNLDKKVLYLKQDILLYPLRTIDPLLKQN